MGTIAAFKALSGTTKAIVGVVTLLAALWVAWFAYDLLVGSKEVEKDLAVEQGDSAIESGKDAVETVGDNQDAAADTQGKVKDIQDEVDKADNGAGADRAARDGLCAKFGLGCAD